MPSSLGFSLTPRELNELKAHHMACSHLIKGCQDAAIRLRRLAPSTSDAEQLAVELRAVEILEQVLGSWCETLSVLRANLAQPPLPLDPALPRWLANDRNVFAGAAGKPASMGATRESGRA
jgi:hypothetical protein